MKKIVLAILLIAILVLSAIGFVACDTVIDVEDMLRSCDKSLEPIALQDGKTIAIQTDLYFVGVYPIAGDKITVSYTYHSNATVTHRFDASGNVAIEQKSNGAVVHVNDLYLVVGIPSSWQNCNLAIVSTVADVNVDDVKVNDVTIKVKTGNVKVDLEKANIVDIENETGAVNVDCTAKYLNVDIDTGAIKVDADVTVLELSSDTGAIKFEVENCASIDVDTDTGSIRGVVDGVKSAYTIITQVGTGSCNVKNQTGDGVHLLEVESQTGSIKITFDR